MATIKASLLISAFLLFAIPVHVRAQSSDVRALPPSHPLPHIRRRNEARSSSSAASQSPVLNPARRHYLHRFSAGFRIGSNINRAADGYVNPRGTADLYVQGMTVPEAIEAFKKPYSKILHDPLINLDFTDFQKPMFIVSGQVGKPGQYELRNDITVTEAIAIAGGFTLRQNPGISLSPRILRLGQVRRLNLKEILNGKNVNEDSRMQEGDMVFVPEKFITNFRKYVPYSVGMYLNPASISMIAMKFSAAAPGRSERMIESGFSNGRQYFARYATIRDWIAVGFRRRKIVLTCFCGVFLGAVGFAWFWAANYFESSMDILVEQDRSIPPFPPRKTPQF